MTDRDGLYGAARFVRACEAEGVRPILGASITVRASTPGAGRRGADGSTSCCSRPTTPATRTCAACSPTRTCWASAATRGSTRCRSARTPRGSSRSPAPGRIRAARRSPGRVDHAARLLDPFREAFGTRSALRGGRAPAREAASTDEIRAMLRLAERVGGARRRDEPGALPRPRRRVRGRRARVHAAPRAARIDERHAPQRGGLVEAARRDARAVLRAPGPVRRDPRHRRHVPLRPGARAHPFPRLPDVGGPQRRRGARRAELARRARARGARDRGPARTAAPRALDDPAHGVRGVLPHRGRHRRRREDDGHPGARAGGRPPARSCATSPASPTSTRCATTCRSSGS